MADLDLFGGFRSGVEPPTEAARRRASTAWEAPLGAPRGNVLRYGVLAFAALAAAAAAALFLSTPWKDSPGFLQQAEAALTGNPDTVLHAKWQMTAISRNPACVHTGAPNQMWIDQMPPHRYRALLGDFPSGVELDPRALICEDKGTAEVGGTLDEVRGSGTVVFEPPNTLGEAPVHFGHPPDEVEKLVQAIAEGRAQDEGATQLDGRAVHRIRLDPDPPSECPYSSCPEDPAYVFVDAETFALVEVHGHGLLLQPDGPIWFRAIVRYETYEYLPRTPANLALTDIRAQHPDAIQR